MYFNNQKTVKLVDGTEMPVLGFGTFLMKEEEHVELYVKAALELGYRHFDTAKAYNNEEQLGVALKKIMAAGVKREELFITTKLWISHKGNPEEALQASLKRLGLDYVDLYLIHWPVNVSLDDDNPKPEKWPLHVLWAKLEALVDQGLTKTIGLSNYNCQIINDLLTYCRIKPAVNQIELNPYNRQEYLTKWMVKNGIVAQAYSSLGNPGFNKNTERVMSDPVIEELAKKYKVTPAQICLNWALSQNYVVIPKSSSFGRLKENYESQNFKMSEEDIESINKLDKGFRIFGESLYERWQAPVFH